MIRCGHSYAPIRATAAASSVTALSSIAERPVPGLTVGDELQPGHPLLRGLDQVEPKVVVHGQREPAHLTDRLLAALDAAPRCSSTIQRAPFSAARLLVGGEHQPERPTRRGAGPGPGTDHAEQHGVEVLHVDRAATPDAPVDDLAGERRHRPVLGVRRYDVQVPVDQQRAQRPVDALRLPVRHQRGPARAPTRTARRRCPPRRAAPRRTSAATRSPGPGSGP